MRLGWRNGEKQFEMNLPAEAILTGTVKLDGKPLAEGFGRLESENGPQSGAVQAVAPRVQ